MAVLSKIRQRSILLIAIIGFCLFAFIIGDIFNSGGFNSMPKDVGSVNGKDIAFEDFRLKVSNLEKSGQGITPMQAVERVWEQEITLALFTEQFDKLGIRVSQKHIIDVLANDPQIAQSPMFKDAAGNFDINKFTEFFKASPDQQQYLESRMKDAELMAKYQIYASLIKGASYATNIEGKLRYEAENNKVSFDYVAVPYSSIKDSEVKVTDEEIIAYMRKNEKKYKADETREVEYVLIEDKPSEEDEKEVNDHITSLMASRVVYNQAAGKNDTLPGFRDTKNLADFVNEYSDIPYDSTYIAKKDLPANHADALMALSEGQVYGPYRDGDYLSISRVTGRKSNHLAKASHILISWDGTRVQTKQPRTKERAKVIADSLLVQAKSNPGMFMMLALTNSEDSSAQSGGDLGYFAPGQMVPAFNDFVFKNPVGTIGLVETEFGYHIINITDKQDAIRLATVARKIQPSDATADQMYQKAVKFEMDATQGDFEKAAKESGLTINPAVKVKAMDEQFGAAGAQRQIVRWAFESGTKVGDIKRFEIANVGNIIARLKKINEEGLLALDVARPQIEPRLKNQKKAEIIKKKLTGNSLEAMAKAAGVQVQSVSDLALESGVIPGMGRELKIVGTAMAIGAGKTSAPIEGVSGVAVVRTTAFNKAPEIKDYKEYISKVKAPRAGDANRVLPALRADADIEDNRAKFNY